MPDPLPVHPLDVLIVDDEAGMREGAAYAQLGVGREARRLFIGHPFACDQPQESSPGSLAEPENVVTPPRQRTGSRPTPTPIVSPCFLAAPRHWRYLLPRNPADRKASP